MKKIALLVFMPVYLIINVSLIAAQSVDKKDECELCGMDRGKHQNTKMIIEYKDNTSTGTCSINCTAALISAQREKTVTKLLISDYQTLKMIDAKKAYWVIGGKERGVMSEKAKWAFENRADAKKFIKKNGGKTATYDDVMKTTFTDMYEDIKIAHAKKMSEGSGDSDIKTHPECKYCGMDRKKYAYSRVLIEYDDGAATGLCSIHCAAIDLAMNINKKPRKIMAGDYYTRNLVDAEKAFWVLGGSLNGVMSIRGKWVFEKKEGAQKFIKENGGRLASLDEVMKAAFVDMWEILR